MQTEDNSVVIQISDDPEAERLPPVIVVKALTERVLPKPTARMSGPHRARGLYGDEAERAYLQLIFGDVGGQGRAWGQGGFGQGGFGGLGGGFGRHGRWRAGAAGSGAVGRRRRVWRGFK